MSFSQYIELIELFSCTKHVLDISQNLYDIGLRKINVVGLSALGCCPSQLRAYKSENGTCIGFLNDIAVDFNDHLRPQFFDLADSLPNVTFGFLSIFSPIMEAINNPSSFGIF